MSHPRPKSVALTQRRWYNLNSFFHSQIQPSYSFLLFLAGSVAHVNVSYMNHNSLDESIHNIGREHLSELESLFSGGVHDAAHQTFAVPVISLVSDTQKRNGPGSVFMQLESDTTLSSATSQTSSSEENSDIPPKKGFWTSLFSRVFKRQLHSMQRKKGFFSSTKVHPLL